MSLPIPNLDDRSFTDLVAEMRALIPRYAPQWTDHNITDPGITLIELLAWLAEMILYRQNIITERSSINFLKLILDRPVPVTVEITLTLDTPQATNVIIPKGTKFATPPDTTGKQIIFETFEDHRIAEQYQEVTLTARNYSVVENEVLGISDGLPDQLFSFAHTPVLIDNFNTSRNSNAYNPNPKITVDGEGWFYVQDFLTEEHEVPPSKSFTVEKATHQLRLSDGRNSAIFRLTKRSLENLRNEEIPNEVLEHLPPLKDQEYTGESTFLSAVEKQIGREPTARYQGLILKHAKSLYIPPKGTEIVCTRYQIVLGEEVRIGKNQNLELLPNTGFPDTIGITSIAHEAAEGGLYILPFEQARKQGLQKFQERFRAISADDFTFLATTVFNELQRASEDRVARAKVVPKKNLNISSDEEKDGEISVIIIPLIGFKITEQSLIKLEEEGISADTLTKLEDLRNQKYTTEEDFLDVLKKTLTESQFIQHKTLILEYASTAPKLINKVWKFLDRRRLVGTRHHVVGPKYVPITIGMVVYRKLFTNENPLRETITQTLKTFLHPLDGGFDGKGWPFGRDLHPSELYQLIENIEGVYYVKELMLNGRSDETPVHLRENELPTISETDITMTVKL